MRFPTRLSLMLAGAIVVVLASPATATVNLLTNPGFEDNGGSLDGWFIIGTTFVSNAGTDNIFRTGTAAAKTFGKGSGCPLPTFDVDGFGQAVASPSVGDVYTFSGYSFVSSGDPLADSLTCNGNRAVAQIAFFDAVSGGSVLARNEIVVADGDFPLDQWVYFEVELPAPAGALRVEALILYLQPGCDTGAAFLDDLSLCAETPAGKTNLLTNSSFDVNLNGWNQFGNVFNDFRAGFIRTPTGAAKFFSTFTPDSDSGIFQTVAAAPGQSYKLTAHALVTCEEDVIQGGNNNFMIMRLQFEDAGTNILEATDLLLADADSPKGNWRQRTLYLPTAPAGTAAISVYLLFVSPIEEGGAIWVDDVCLEAVATTSTPDARVNAQLLHQNMPNPFSPSTRIGFEIEERGSVRISVYDVAGRYITTLADRVFPDGAHSVIWDGRTAQGIPAAAGIYYYTMRTDAGQTTRRMMLMR